MHVKVLERDGSRARYLILDEEGEVKQVERDITDAIASSIKYHIPIEGAIAIEDGVSAVEAIEHKHEDLSLRLELLEEHKGASLDHTHPELVEAKSSIDSLWLDLNKSVATIHDDLLLHRHRELSPADHVHVHKHHDLESHLKKADEAISGLIDHGHPSVDDLASRLKGLDKSLRDLLDRVSHLERPHPVAEHFHRDAESRLDRLDSNHEHLELQLDRVQSLLYELRHEMDDMVVHDHDTIHNHPDLEAAAASLKDSVSQLRLLYSPSDHLHRWLFASEEVMSGVAWTLYICECGAKEWRGRRIN